MEASRAFFWNVGHVRTAIYVLAFIPSFLIAYGIYRRFLLWRKGGEHNRLTHFPARIFSFFQNGIFQRRVFREAYPGLMHGLIFFGFVILFIGTTLIALQEDFTLPLFHWEYLKGSFYLFYSLVLDIFGALAIMGVLMALYRRLVLMPDRLDHRKDDNLILYLFLLILITGFLIEGFRIYASELQAHPDWSRWSPVGLFLASSLKHFGIGYTTSLYLHRFFWWLHLIAAFAFLSLIPYTKLIHIFTGAANTFLRSNPPIGRLIPIDIENSEVFGAGKYQDFSWKHLFDLDVCVRCGRCQDVCPAYLSGKPLSPKALIQDLKSGMVHNLDEKDPPSIIGTIIQEETIWSCTTCMACVEQCPLFINPMDKVIEMRRYRVLGCGSLPDEARPMMRNLEIFGDVNGRGAAHREDWSFNLGVPHIGTDGLNAEILLWVGCSGSFHPRYQEAMRAMVKILKTGGVRFGVLGKEELCCGDVARRLGDEEVFLSLARRNIASFKKYNIKKIVTLCPHGFNTLKNEYRALEGGDFEVVHAVEFVLELIKKNKISLKYPVVKQVTIHDPCYLGRANHIYEPLREMIKSVPGIDFKELRRNRENALCCGGGGGRMWLHENAGENINHLRSEEIKESGVQVVGTACPFCLTMLEDGINSLEMDNRPKVMDLIEIIAASLEEAKNVV